MEQQNSNPEKTHREIDVVALVKKVAKDRKTLGKFLGVSAVIGVIVALSTPREFTTEVVLAPEPTSSGLSLPGNLSELASTFGVDIGKASSQDAILPEIYPDVFSSKDFLLELFNVPVRLKDDPTPRTYLNHLLHDIRTPFWHYPMKWLGKLLQKKETPGQGKNAKDPYRLSRVDTELCKDIAESISCLIDKKTNEIYIDVTDQDPMVAAIMADTLQRRLQGYITEYRTKKARIDFEYYKAMVADCKKRYEKAQYNYVNYADAHFDVLLQSLKSKETQLENEMQLQYNAYSQMVIQMRLAEAKVQERTPAFTVIQHAYTSARPSSRPKLVTLMIFMFLGGLLGCAWILFGRDFYYFKRK